MALYQYMFEGRIVVWTRMAQLSTGILFRLALVHLSLALFAAKNLGYFAEPWGAVRGHGAEHARADQPRPARDLRASAARDSKGGKMCCELWGLQVPFFLNPIGVLSVTFCHIQSNPSK